MNPRCRPETSISAGRTAELTRRFGGGGGRLARARSAAVVADAGGGQLHEAGGADLRGLLGCALLALPGGGCGAGRPGAGALLRLLLGDEGLDACLVVGLLDDVEGDVLGVAAVAGQAGGDGALVEVGAAVGTVRD